MKKVAMGNNLKWALVGAILLNAVGACVFARAQVEFNQSQLELNAAQGRFNREQAQFCNTQVNFNAAVLERLCNCREKQR